MATQFFVGDAIPDEICRYLPNCERISTKKEEWDDIKKIKQFRLRSLWMYRPRIWFTHIYAQDHLLFSPQLIGHQKYYLLEDAPGCFSIVSNPHNKFFKVYMPDDLKTQLWLKIYKGSIYGHSFGRNSQCINRILTSPEDFMSYLIRGKKYQQVDLQQMWDSSDEQKRSFIKNMFGITHEMEEAMSKAETLYLSQPFVEDCGLSKDEIKDIVQPHYEKWKSGGFVIKPHPRDKFDYRVEFPEAQIMQTKAPMQLLNIMGMKFKRAITVCSTAISSLSPETERIWLSSSINEKISSVYGIQ